jgi:hypothetical protein
LLAAVQTFLDVSPSQNVSDEDAALLLYALGRDNEFVHIQQMLERHPQHTLQIASAALRCADKEARWQFAVVLGRIGTLNRSHTFASSRG